MLNTLGQFGGSPVENARQHIKSFLEICNSFKIHGVSNDVLELKLFPYSLRDKAKAWLNNLPTGSFQSWTELCRSFLAKFNYNNMTDKLRNEITSFMQDDDKSMHEAWERYIDLFKRCPMHGLPEWTQVSIFYNSVNTPMRMMLDASANGTLLDKPPREGVKILEKLAQNDYQHPTTRRGSMKRGTAQLDSSDTILAQLLALTNMVKNMQKQSNIQEVKECDVQHIQPGMEEASQLLLVEPEQHPESQYFKSAGISKSAKAESTTESVEISYALNTRQRGGFPSDTKVSKGDTHEQCKAITTRSGKVVPTPKSKQGEDTVAKHNAATVADEPALAVAPASAEAPDSAGDDHEIPLLPK
ncbi:hypothetical protein V6N12_042425 [Hibiscus sabdariffa]|uniref:Retrotransposon gag domain-containing protein n=1 Tax=Hibiscus sabdariffa TaxID=183260 RepID=A0ABR2EER3_9ROSI